MAVKVNAGVDKAMAARLKQREAERVACYKCGAALAGLPTGHDGSGYFHAHGCGSSGRLQVDAVPDPTVPIVNRTT